MVEKGQGGMRTKVFAYAFTPLHLTYLYFYVTDMQYSMLHQKITQIHTVFVFQNKLVP